MTTNLNENPDIISGGEDLVDELVGDFGQPPVENVPVRSFKPWHKPRKHYIRIYQWCVELRKLIAKLSLAGRSVSYLGLPGSDMLDIKTLHGVCENAGVKLRYLGFNGAGGNSDASETLISDNELRSQGWEFIDHVSSRVVFDSFERVAAPTSLARKALIEKASFDVVNLDLCNCIARRCAVRAESTLSALKVLMDIQHARRGEPWLLFITTRTVRDGVDPELWARLCELVDRNLTNSEFHMIFGSVCLLASGKKFSESEVSLDKGVFSKSFVVALGKWILNVMKSGWTVNLTSVMTYTVAQEDGADMYSLSFWIERKSPPLSDSTGIAASPAPQCNLDDDETRLACKMVEAVSAARDADRILATDQALNLKIRTKSSLMMEKARYDPELYGKWIDAGCPSREPDGL
ncbi:MAG: hypothetical protein JNL82_00745 [Myxococcales bacterium]|nr:hypothetical protein [Myxococcales bacterium]